MIRGSRGRELSLQYQIQRAAADRLTALDAALTALAALTAALVGYGALYLLL